MSQCPQGWQEKAIKPNSKKETNDRLSPLFLPCVKGKYLKTGQKQHELIENGNHFTLNA